MTLASANAPKAGLAVKLRCSSTARWKLSEGDYAVTGAPVVVQELNRAISRSIVILLLAAVLVMALTLLLVFRARLRLLPLLVALAATALAFGLSIRR